MKVLEGKSVFSGIAIGKISILQKVALFPYTISFLL